VADRSHAEVDEILGRKYPQYLGIDIVVLKDLGVALKPQAFEPRRNILADYCARGRSRACGSHEIALTAIPSRPINSTEDLSDIPKSGRRD
jgi:hypothetical protein